MHLFFVLSIKKKVTNPSCLSLHNLTRTSKMLHRPGLRQESQGSIVLNQWSCPDWIDSILLYALKPNIGTTGSKDLTTDLLFFIKIATTFNFQFLNFQKAIWFLVKDLGTRIECNTNFKSGTNIITEVWTFNHLLNNLLHIKRLLQQTLCAWTILQLLSSCTSVYTSHSLNAFLPSILYSPN